MMDEDKVRAFIEKYGVTPCPPMFAEDAYRQPGAKGIKSERKAPCSAAAMTPELRLARAKILSMLCDLGGRGFGVLSYEREKHRHDAYRWFFGSSDFGSWCEMAGYDPAYVRQKARQVHDKGLPLLRAPSGKGKNYLERQRKRRLR